MLALEKLQGLFSLSSSEEEPATQRERETDLRYRGPEARRPPEAERRRDGHPPHLHLVVLHVQARVQQVGDVAAVEDRSRLSRTSNGTTASAQSLSLSTRG